MFSPSFDFWVSLLFALANSRAFGEIQLLRGLRNTLLFTNKMKKDEETS